MVFISNGGTIANKVPIWNIKVGYDRIFDKSKTNIDEREWSDVILNEKEGEDKSFRYKTLNDSEYIYVRSFIYPKNTSSNRPVSFEF